MYVMTLLLSHRRIQSKTYKKYENISRST